MKKKIVKTSIVEKICVLTLILFLIPIFIDRKLNIKLPDTLEKIILLFTS